jgi:hypothetical protein
MAQQAAAEQSQPFHPQSDRTLLGLAGGASLRLALQVEPATALASPGLAGLAATLRDPNLVADLRQARAARFSDRYARLSLRRRRAQIAARHALDE